MYDQCEDGLVAPGNTARYKHPVRKDANGKIIDNESIAFGCPVTIDYVHVGNVFFLNETRDNTHGKEDGNQGGQRKAVPRGEIPKELFGVKTHIILSHPSLMLWAPSDSSWSYLHQKSFLKSGLLALPFFVEWDPDNEFNMGPGKRHLELSLISTIDGKKIPVLLDANPKASMSLPF